jgi:hypothetical protein
MPPFRGSASGENMKSRLSGVKAVVKEKPQKKSQHVVVVVKIGTIWWVAAFRTERRRMTDDGDQETRR